MGAFSNRNKPQGILHKLSLGKEIFIFLLMPRNKWRGCGRRNGGEHTFVFKYRIKGWLGGSVG